MYLAVCLKKSLSTLAEHLYHHLKTTLTWTSSCWSQMTVVHISNAKWVFVDMELSYVLSQSQDHSFPITFPNTVKLLQKYLKCFSMELCFGFCIKRESEVHTHVKSQFKITMRWLLLWTEKRKEERLVHLQKNDEIQRGRRNQIFQTHVRQRGGKRELSPLHCCLSPKLMGFFVCFYDTLPVIGNE